jgi:hypothetical protein
LIGEDQCLVIFKIKFRGDNLTCSEVNPGCTAAHPNVETATLLDSGQELAQDYYVFKVDCAAQGEHQYVILSTRAIDFPRLASWVSG